MNTKFGIVITPVEGKKRVTAGMINTGGSPVKKRFYSLTWIVDSWMFTLLFLKFI